MIDIARTLENKTPKRCSILLRKKEAHHLKVVPRLTLVQNRVILLPEMILSS